jgi:transposase
MSITASAAVWRCFSQGVTQKLVLLALADFADKHWEAWPSMATLAAKVGLSVSQTQRVVRSLENGGWLVLVANEHGGRPGATRRYKITLPEPICTADAPARVSTSATGSTAATGSRDATGSTDATGSADATRRIVQRERVAQVRPDPDIEPGKASERVEESEICGRTLSSLQHSSSKPESRESHGGRSVSRSRFRIAENGVAYEMGNELDNAALEKLRSFPADLVLDAVREASNEEPAGRAWVGKVLTIAKRHDQAVRRQHQPGGSH